MEGIESKPHIKLMNKLMDVHKEATGSAFLRGWMENARQMVRYFGRADGVLSAADCPPSNFDGRNVVIVGSGPSAAMALKECLGTTLVAGVTAVPYMLRIGVRPDVVVVADTNPILHRILHFHAAALEHTNVVLPVIAPACWTRWPVGKQTYFYKPLMQVTRGTLDGPVNTILEALFPEVGSHITQGGCVANVMIGLAHIWAKLWPVSRAILIGCDYGWPAGDPSAARRLPIHFGGSSFEPTTLVREADRMEFNEMSVSLSDIFYAVTTLLFTAESDMEVVLGSGPSLLDGYLPTWSLQRAMHGGSIYDNKDERYESCIKAAERFTKDVEPLLAKGIEGRRAEA